MANYITQEGYNKKMEELAALEAQRPMIKQAIAEARDKGTFRRMPSMTRPRRPRVCSR